MVRWAQNRNQSAELGRHGILEFLLDSLRRLEIDHGLFDEDCCVTRQIAKLISFKNVKPFYFMLIAIMNHATL